MTNTDKLKAWLVENAEVKADATDEQFVAAAAVAMAKQPDEDGFLSAETLAELNTDPDATKATALDDALTGITKALTGIDERLIQLEKPPEKPKPEPAPVAGLEKLFAAGAGDGASLTDGPNVNVKSVAKMYDHTTKALYHPERTAKGALNTMRGRAVTVEGGRQLHEQSEFEKAIAGAWMQFAINSATGHKRRLTDHTLALVEYAKHEMEWGGDVADEFGQKRYVQNRMLGPGEQKQLIDDATSGGIEIAPIVFDDALITVPLLFGEFFPKVNLVNIPSGRRVEGGQLDNVTVGWGGGDATAIVPFPTAGMVTAFDTFIHVVDGAIRIGLDFLTDTPINVTQEIIRMYGEAILGELDRRICLGTGVGQPTGVMVTGGTTVVGFGGIAATIGGYLQLMFSVAKQEQAGFDKGRIVFGANETTYRRARAIPVDPTDDARLIFGMDPQDYMLFGHPYGINANMANAQIFYCNLARYRMYRRLGVTRRTSTEGETLMLSNLMLIIARARYGGQLERGAAAAVVTTAEA